MASVVQASSRVRVYESCIEDGAVDVLFRVGFHFGRDEWQIGSEYDRVSVGELTKFLRKIFSCLLEFARQDFVPSLFLEKFRLPVWKFEKYAYYSHRHLRLRDIDYNQLYRHRIKTLSDKGDDKLLEDISSGLALSYLLYWSVLDEGEDVSVDLPNISDTGVERR